MVDSMLFNLLLNIGLLVLIATMLTNLPPVRALLLEEKQTFRSRLWLSLIFGMVSICSTYIDSHPDYELTEDNCRIYNRKRR